MEIVRRECRVPVRNQTDVLVVGGGPAGFGAAIAAARAGMKVSLVEQSGMLGGMWTLGLLSPFFDNRNKEGLNRELREKLQSKKAWGGLWDMSFDPIQMAFLLDDYATEHHLDLLLHSVATEPILDGNQIRGVIVENKSGAQAILARVVIDCTGDGDIAARAGAPAPHIPVAITAAMAAASNLRILMTMPPFLVCLNSSLLFRRISVQFVQFILTK